jgi:choline dehydrogenase
MIHQGSDADLVLKPDVCVVGSGPGGAMVASRLSRAGAKVVVLEEGGYHQKDEFDMQESTAFPRLYQDRGNRASADLSISVLQGRAVGGGTVVNWTTSYRTPDDVLAHWRDRDGLSLTPGMLRPHFEEVERRLGVQKVELEDTNANNRAIYDGCKKLGWQVDTTSRNVRGCLRTGYCGMGCPVDAKQSAALTYLPDAVAAGAEVYANCRVRKIEWSGKRATAAVAQVLDAHFYGAPQSVASHHFAHRNGGAGFFIEAAPVHPMLASIAMPGFGGPLRTKMGLLPNVAATISLMIDGFDPSEAGGTVTLRPDGGPRLDYPFGERTYECFRAGMKAIAQLHLANGAREVVSFHATPIHIAREADLARIDAAPIGPNRFGVFTAHQMGGCRMGQDSSRSVVDERLQIHGFDNLFVIDGSVFPTSLGVNPMESIYGVASWASDQVSKALS